MENSHYATAKKWWWQQRYRYNKGLIVAGLFAFVLYGVLGPIVIAPHEEFEETIFEIAFQAGAYVIMMVFANIFYTLGWMTDLVFNTDNSQRYRERLYWLGYWFSFALPNLIILSVVVRFMILGK